MPCWGWRIGLVLHSYEVQVRRLLSYVHNESNVAKIRLLLRGFQLMGEVHIYLSGLGAL